MFSCCWGGISREEAIEKALQPHGFVLTQVHEMVMRSELGKPVAGVHVVARLPV